MSKSYFEGAETAKVFDRGVYFQNDSKYKLRVKCTKVIETRDKGPAFVADFLVLESSNAKDPVGCTRNWFQSLQKKDIAFGAIKELVYALAGMDRHDDKDAKVIAKEVEPKIKQIMDDLAEKNSEEGTEVYLETASAMTRPTPQKPQGTPITRHTWYPAK